MNKKRCPVCGSEEVLEKKETITITEPFAGKDNIEIIKNTCLACESEGDFFDQNENIIEETIKNLKQKSVEGILKYFINNKISMSSIERALEMPQRTLAKWKNKGSKTSSAGIALLRFIRLFPWLLEVAENKYDYQKAENIQTNSVIQKILDKNSFPSSQEGQGQYFDFEVAGQKGIIGAAGGCGIYEYAEEDFESFGIEITEEENSEKRSPVACSAI
ncbi:MAG: hypothetical protein IMZ52_05950 [Actinobacteria bacterium]|nr:hypothetical protein [Actinomycetota bacterium]